jgi:hypothetical protein
VNTSFSGLNPYFTEGASQERAAFLAAGFRDDYIEALLNDQRKAYDGFMKGIGRLCGALPNQRILIRPHPFENPEPYQRAFAKYPNVIVDGRGNVLNAIARAKCVVHLNCGTSVESVLLGKLPICLDWLNTGTLLSYAPLPREISYCANSIEDVVEAVRDIHALEASFSFTDMRERFIVPWFSEGDGKAAERVAERIVDASGSLPTRKTSLRLSLLGGSLRPTKGQLLQGIMANLLGPEATAKLRASAEPRRKSKVFSVDDVQQALDCIARVAPESRLLHAKHGRHPVTRRKLASIVVTSSVADGARAPNTARVH